VISYIIIVAFNFGHGPLAFTIASEMAVGRNRNKIMSSSIVSFFFTVWVIAFTSPYIYYDGGLGPMLGFVYAGSTCITLAYVWFCVGETTGRSHLELELFFQERIPVQKWRRHQFNSMDIVHEGRDGGVFEQVSGESVGGQTLIESAGLKGEDVREKGAGKGSESSGHGSEKGGVREKETV